MRSLAPLVATVLACASTHAASRGDSPIEKITVYYKTSDKIEFKAFVQDGAFGNGVSNVEWFTVASTYAEARIEFRAKVRGQGDTGWKRSGNESVGGPGAVIEAVSFRLAGKDAGGYSLCLSVLTATQTAMFETDKPDDYWAEFGNEPITGFVLQMVNKDKQGKLGGQAERQKGVSDDLAATVEREGGRKILPQMFATIGMTVGYVYGGPPGAIGGAFLGYALGAAAEKAIDRAVAYTKQAGWGDKIEPYCAKLRKGKDTAGTKALDWLANVDPTKIGSKGFDNTPLDPRTWHPSKW